MEFTISIPSGRLVTLEWLNGKVSVSHIDIQISKGLSHRLGSKMSPYISQIPYEYFKIFDYSDKHGVSEFRTPSWSGRKKCNNSYTLNCHPIEAEAKTILKSLKKYSEDHSQGEVAMLNLTPTKFLFFHCNFPSSSRMTAVSFGFRAIATVLSSGIHPIRVQGYGSRVH